MASRSRRRKVEVYRLTISGLPQGQDYAQFLAQTRGRVGARKNAVWPKAEGEKSHGLSEATLAGGRLRMLFFSFMKGYRPDVLDTEQFLISPTPLAAHETGVEWTHVLGGAVNGRFLLLIEKPISGVRPQAVEKYLQWMVDEFASNPAPGTAPAPGNTPLAETGPAAKKPVVISIEAEAGSAFVQRVESLDRITKATLRTVRPNPGWADLENALGSEADHSDAHKAEVVMTARRKASLRKDEGIVAAILNRIKQKTSVFAAVEGEHQGIKDSFTTDRLGRHEYLNFKLDQQGQVLHDDAWDKLGQMMDRVD